MILERLIGNPFLAFYCMAFGLESGLHFVLEVCELEPIFFFISPHLHARYSAVTV